MEFKAYLPNTEFLRDGEQISFGLMPFETPATPQTVTISNGIPSAEAFGTSKFNRNFKCTGIASAEAFGASKFNVNVKPTGILSAEAFGATRLNLKAVCTGIPSEEAFGLPKMLLSVVLAGVPSEEAFGLATFSGGAVIVTSITPAPSNTPARATITRV